MKNTPRSMIRMILPTLLVLLWTASVAVVVQAQSPNYDNYGYDNDGMDDNNYQQEQQQQEDSLYHDYAMRQQEKGGAGAAG